MNNSGENLGSENLGKKIFVVDDDVSIGDVITNLLVLEGYSVHTFVAGSDAIESAKYKKADLVLLDYFMPGENAIEIISGLRGTLGDKLPIVLMSANAEGAQRAKELPVNEFIPKPFPIESLLETIKRNVN